MYSSIYKFSPLPKTRPPQNPRHLFVYRYGASALMMAASSGSHLSPLESSFSAEIVSHSSATPQRALRQRTLVVEQLLARLGGVLGVGRLDNGVHGTRLLAEAAVDALGHVNIVARRPPGAVGALLSLDRDGLRRADGLAQLAGDAALLARGVSSKRVLSAEPGRDGALWCHPSAFSPRPGCSCPLLTHLFKRIVDGIAAQPQMSAFHPHLKQGPRKTHGGRKNCSSSTYMPRNISVSRK